MRIECDTYIEAVIPIYILGYFEYKFFFFFWNSPSSLQKYAEM